MGARGPKAAPNNVRQLRGDSPSRRQASKPPSDRMPTPPAHLAAYAKSVWKELGPDLWQMGWLRPTTRHVFVAYCEAAAANREASKELHNAGQDPEILVKGDKGRVVKHPALQIFRDTADVMLRVSRDWDLGAPAAVSDDAKAQYLS